MVHLILEIYSTIILLELAYVEAVRMNISYFSMSLAF